ncbi:amidohydrolase family protein [Aquibacillus koreensis]|uniref:adenine deaminase n=1 Tax=Aquibacillus koreensis TaxID=279446 RepID=A0A9X4AIX8_9BACI|nr:adenine deaminase C-terminal domain-containing protein [Aquibacillus koreensis]MCT2536807.1 amidohydrolase family protein [Aquibacillus koreensis]MDC3421436.1 amidohydrolase family protein [Aquibacillus koreensis]
MDEHLYRWRNRELREHVSVIDNKFSPTLLLKNATYLNVSLKQWIKAHIWIYKDRIVYVGDQLPDKVTNTEVIDCSGNFIVPGYIEPHAHPFQLYNPHQLAKYASQTGTTTLMNDNLLWLYLTTQKKAFTLIGEFMKLPVSMYWWARFDSQTLLQDEQEYFNNGNILAWLQHEAVVQGGELTCWPQVLKDDDRILYWMQETRRLGKPIEGHFPGASEKTLVKMKLLGASADHEAMTGKEVFDRIRLGYQVSLRYSSIRPDLPTILSELKELGVKNYDSMTMTTDGSTPAFYENGMMDRCIEIAIEAGVPIEDAYMMASYNAARHFNMGERLGAIAPGRVAHINILDAKEHPTPISVIAKGKWMKRDGVPVDNMGDIRWMENGITPLELDWKLEESDLQFSMPIGMEMVNDVIIRAYPVSIDANVDKIEGNNDESFLMLIDRHGKWRVNTIIKGFTSELGGLVSSYSTTGDIVLIGKSKADLMLAFNRMKELGGGIVLANDGKIIFELPLQLSGMMYAGDMATLMEKDKELKEKLKAFGYKYNDPPYNLLFLSSMHLPFIRITPQGIVDVKKKEVLFPAIMR